MVDQFTIWPIKQFYKDFQILEPIGQGQYGEVFKAKMISSREPIKDISKEIVAVKILKCSRASEKLRIKDEIELLKDLQHDNVLKLIAAYEKSDEIIQVLEYLGYVHSRHTYFYAFYLIVSHIMQSVNSRNN